MAAAFALLSLTAAAVNGQTRQEAAPVRQEAAPARTKPPAAAGAAAQSPVNQPANQPAKQSAKQSANAPGNSLATAPSGDLAAARAGASGRIEAYVVRAHLVSALEMVGTLGGVPVQVDQAIDRNIGTAWLSGSQDEVIAELARQNGLIYWFDGMRFTVAPAQGQPRHVIGFGELPYGTVRTLVSATLPAFSAETVRIDPQSRLIHVNGPRELRDMITQAMNGADTGRPADVSIIRFGIAGTR